MAQSQGLTEMHRTEHEYPIFFQEWKLALWDQFFMHAPRRQRQPVELEHAQLRQNT